MGRQSMLSMMMLQYCACSHSPAEHRRRTSQLGGAAAPAGGLEDEEEAEQGAHSSDDDVQFVEEQESFGGMCRGNISH